MVFEPQTVFAGKIKSRCDNRRVKGVGDRAPIDKLQKTLLLDFVTYGWSALTPGELIAPSC